jgi:hypothetical protein
MLDNETSAHKVKTHHHRRESSRIALEHAVKDFLYKKLHHPMHRDAFHIEHDGDGKPTVVLSDKASNIPPTISASHTGHITLAIASENLCACDIEQVRDRSAQQWHDLLGSDGVASGTAVAAESREGTAAAYTRVWTVIECLKKSGMPASPLPVAQSISDDGWVTFTMQHHSLNIHTLSFQDSHTSITIVVALLLQTHDEVKSDSREVAGKKGRHAHL